ncbi:unnamed protein product [Chrysoparadoxa australica]
MALVANQSLSVNQRRHPRLNEYFAVISLPREGDTDEASGGRVVGGLRNCVRDGLYMPRTPGTVPPEQIPHPLKARYMAAVQHRFPPVDYPDHPFPAGLSLFCLPAGLKLSLQEELPTLFSFVHTRANGQHMFGYCLTFYELLPESDRKQLDELLREYREIQEMSLDSGEQLEPEELPDITKDTPVYAPKCICLLSVWPYFTCYKEWLTNLYRISLSPSNIPLERYISNFMIEVETPQPGRTKVEYPMGPTTISFLCPPPNDPIAWRTIPYEHLFQCLDHQNIVTLFEALLVERSILLISSQLSLLTTCAEVLTLLLFPLSWTHVYIPVLPESLLGVLTAPMPFLVGVHKSFLHASTDIPDTVVQVDLDTNTLTMGRSEPLPPLPSKRRSKLMAALEENANFSYARTEEWRDVLIDKADLVFNMAMRPCDFSQEMDQMQEEPNWAKVREAFLRFFVTIFKDYRKFLVLQKQTFQAESFVEKLDPEFRPFVTKLTQTQAFSNFIDARIQPDPEDLDITFFDESIDSKRNRSRLHVIKQPTRFLSAAAFGAERGSIPQSPDLSGLDMDKPPTVHRGFPELQHDAYPQPRTVPAERYRESTFYNKKRGGRKNSGMFRLNRLDEEALAMSPQATVFSIHLMAFAAAIGREPGLSEQLGLKKKTRAASMVGEGMAGPPVNCVLYGHRVADLIDYLRAGGERDGHKLMDVLEKELMVDRNATAQGPLIMGEEVKGDNELGVPANQALPDWDSPEEKAYARNQMLCLAFELLDIMGQGLEVEELVYRTLIGACGRCGNSERAMEVVEHMMTAGIVPDAMMQHCLLEAYAMDQNWHAGNPFELLDWSKLKARDKKEKGRGHALDDEDRKEDRFTLKRFMKKFDKDSSQGQGQGQSTQGHEGEKDTGGAAGAGQGEGNGSGTGPNVMHRMINSLSRANNGGAAALTNGRPGSPQLSCRLDDVGPLSKGTSLHMLRQIALGHLLLTHLFEGIVLDTESETCPACHRQLTSKEVQQGWEPDPNIYTTTCPGKVNGDQPCGRKFVARFSVFSTQEGWEGSTGVGTTLYPEYLPPWVLRKEVHNIIMSYGIEYLCSDEFRLSKGPNETPRYIQLVLQAATREKSLPCIKSTPLSSTLTAQSFGI